MNALEQAYEALLRSLPDKELLGYETMDEAMQFHKQAVIDLGDYIRRGSKRNVTYACNYCGFSISLKD